MRNAATSILLICLCCACSASDDAGRGAGSSAGPGAAAGGSTVAGGSGGSGAAAFGNAPQGSNVTGQSGASAGTASGAQDGPCDVVHLNASPSTPDMLIVLDRSGSMGEEGRWMPSAAAVRGIVESLQAQIRFGLALFPDPATTAATTSSIDITPCLTDPDPVTCAANLLADAGVANNGNDGACAPGKIVVPVALNNAAAIGAQLDMTQPNGGTPTPGTLQNLLDEFAAPSDNPDVVTPPKFILLVTDGQPTCPAGLGSATTPQDIDASNAAIEALTARGVRTYVIGYNTTGPGNEMLASVLDGFAVRGGTGDMQHRPVEDEQSLLTEFQRIAGAAVSCTFALDQAPPQADHVLVRVDGVQVNLDDPNGWHLVGDRTVELVGTACDTLQSDGDHMVDAEVHCDVVTPE